jgi:hypothetical protein
MSYWGQEKPDGFATVTGTNTRTVVDLTAVEVVSYDSKSDVFLLVTGGGAKVEMPGISLEDRDRIEQSWMAMRRKR